MRLVAVYAVLVGVLMIGQWGLSLTTGQVPELETEPLRIAAHLGGEATTAITLIVGGGGLLARAAWASRLTLVALGMLIYTVIVSPGYFAQRGEWPMVILFSVLLILSIASALAVARPVQRRP
jgi:hypothetical protein